METLVSKGSSETNTERHYQRASNHNHGKFMDQAGILKDIIKEHQITTEGLAPCTSRELKDIIKEHQITT